MPTIIIDLDHTLLNTTAFKEALAKSLALTPKQWDKAYEQFLAEYQLFNCADFLRGVPKQQQQQFYDTLKQLTHYLYPDSLKFLQQALTQGWQVVLFTFGHPTWQQLKLSYLPLPKQIQLVTTDQLKVNTIAPYITEQTILIDDKAKEIDAIKQAFPAITAYWIQRPNGKYHKPEPTLADFSIKNLTTIFSSAAREKHN